MNVVLTGGGGFIGSHLSHALYKLGHKVTAVDSLMVNNLLADREFEDIHRHILQQRMARYNGVQLIVADCRDYTLLSPICKSLKPEVIVHLAAVAHQTESQKSAHSTFDHSLRTLENALDIAVNLKVRRFVYFSSSTVYGDWPLSGVVSENDPCKPKGIYGALKLAGEGIVRAYGREYGLEYVIIRPSALYGPGCISGRVIQRFIESALTGHDLAAGPDSIDFTYIDDLVAGAILAIQQPEAANQTYNLTFGHGRKVAEAARLVRNYFPNIEVREADLDPRFSSRGTLSIDKARQELGFHPQYPLEKGIASYINWYKENGYAQGHQGPQDVRRHA